MKFYSTATSERASKGQGGNKELNIKITCKNEDTKEFDNVAGIYITQTTDGQCHIVFNSLVGAELCKVTLPKQYSKK